MADEMATAPISVYIANSSTSPSVTEPPCSFAKDGLRCEAYFDFPYSWFRAPNDIVQLTCLIFVMFICLKKAPLRDSINLYAINLFIPMFINAVVLMLTEIMFFLKFYGIVSQSQMDAANYSVSFSLCTFFTSFRIMSPILLLSIYLAFSQPFIYSRFFSYDLWMKYLLATQLFTLILSIVVTLFDQNIITAFQDVFCLVAFFTTVTITILASISIIRYHHKHNVRDSDGQRKLRQLISVITYMIPPNLAMAPNFALAVLNLILFIEQADRMPEFQTYAWHWSFFGQRLTAPLTVLSTLICLPLYRRIIWAMLRCKETKTIEVTVVTKFSSNTKI